MAEQSAIPTLLRSGQPNYSAAAGFSSELISDLVHKFGHEIDNPLTAIISLSTIMGRSDLNASTGDPEKRFRKYCASLVSEAWRVSALTNRLVQLLSVRRSSGSATPLFRTLNSTLSKLQDREEFADLNVRLQLPEIDGELALDAAQLNTILIEVFLNAYEAALKTARPTVSVSAQFFDEVAEITVVNAAQPAPQKELAEIFLPFVTSSEEVRHIGIGLTVAWCVLERVGGSITVEEWSNGENIEFHTRIRIPRAIRASVEAVSLLAVESDATLGLALVKILKLAFPNSHVESASCVDAISRFDQLKPQVVLLDLSCTELPTIVAHVRRLNPDLIGVGFTSSASARSRFESAVSEYQRPIISKPFDTVELVTVISQLTLGK